MLVAAVVGVTQMAPLAAARAAAAMAVQQILKLIGMAMRILAAAVRAGCLQAPLHLVLERAALVVLEL